MAEQKGTADVAVGFCLDESGSMSSCWDATINGFNEYRKSLRKQEGKTTLTLTKFSAGGGANFRVVHASQPIKAVTKLDKTTYTPHGGTPLYDAIGHTITEMDAHLKTLDEQPSVIIVIQTDGFENSSREYTREGIAKLIKRREKKGWKFIYLGADQDAVTAERVSTGLGVSPGASVVYAAMATDAAFASVGDSTNYVRKSSIAGQSVSSAAMASNTRTAYEARTGSVVDTPAYTDPNVSPGKDWSWNATLGYWVHHNTTMGK